MRQKAFGDFLDKKKRESIKQLRLLKQILESNGMKVDNFLESSKEDDPYIYCFNPTKAGSFDGVRIYKIGDHLAFRIQKENKTHPYGSAYSLPIEDIFNDFLGDDGVDELKAGKKVIEAVTKEVRMFFDRSVEAEKTQRERDDRNNSLGSVLTRPNSTDYSNLIYSRG